MSKTISLGIVISALGTGAAAAAIGTVSDRLSSIHKRVDQANTRMQALGLKTIDAFTAQKKAAEQARAEMDKHQQAATSMGKQLAEARKFQGEATTLLENYRKELANQATPATDAQRLKLKLLGDQAKGAGKDVRQMAKEFEEAKTKGKAAEESYQRQVRTLQDLRRELGQTGIATDKLAEHRRRITAAITREQAEVAKLTKNYDRLQAAQKQHAAARADMNSRVGDVAAAYGMGRMLGAPIGAHVRQDEALNKLEVSMMQEGGKVSPLLSGLKRQIVELGNALPGTTADYADLSTTMISLGVPAEKLMGNALNAAANLRVVLGMGSEAAGETVVKLQHAYKLTDAELAKTADIAQRAKFAFGMKPEDLRVAASYQAAQLNYLHLGGSENMKKLMVMQGMANLKGLEGSSFGTNMAMMLQRMAIGPQMLEKAKRGMKGAGKDILEDLGITFEFFDKKGKFRGLEAMIKEFEKFKLIEAKYGEKGVSTVSNALFGIEAARPAMILAEAGTKGYQAAMKRFEEQASLQERIKKILASSRNVWEALTGSVENFGAAAAGPAVLALHPLANGLNTATGHLTTFLEKHPLAAKVLGLTTATVLGSTIAFLGMGAAMSVVKFAWAGAQLIPGVTLLTKGLGMARLAVLGLGRVLLFTPIGLAITAIALGALLIWKYWEPITRWFGAAWQETSRCLGAVWKDIKIGFTMLWQDAKTQTDTAWIWLKGLPGRFRALGGELLDGLIGGVKSKLAAAKETIVGFGHDIKGWFSETLGIRSPSLVFRGFGLNIGEGATQGIMASVPGVQSAVGKLAAVALAGSVAASGSAYAGVSKASQYLQGGATGQMSITYAPVINLAAGTPAEVRQQVDQALKISQDEFERMLARAEQNKRRKGYN